MPRVSPGDAAKRWSSGASGAGTRYSEGVRNVTTAPGAKAAAKVDKYRQGVTNSVEKWRTRTAGVSLSDWQEAAANKGASRYSEGVAQAEGKMAAFNQQFYPFLETVERELAAMPDLTLEQRAEKAKQAALKIAKFQRR